MTSTFFDEAEPLRRIDGEPYLIPRGGGSQRFRYTRASSLSEHISDLRHLFIWEKRLLARGLGQREDLGALAAAETYVSGFAKDALDREGLRENARSGRRLDLIIERAQDHVRIHEKADYGTAVHAFTEPGADHNAVPARMRFDTDSFVDIIKELGIRIIGTEIFTANDAIMSAGTFDHLMWVPGYGNVITDKKTGNNKPHEFGIQLASYAHGDVYNVEDDSRITLEQFAGRQEINREVGLVFLIKNGKTDIIEVDLVQGWKGATVAADARDYNALPSADMLNEALPTIRRAAKLARQELLEEIQQANSATLRELWLEKKHLWTDDHTEAARARKESE